MNISYFISILIAFTLTTYLAIPKIYSICLLLLFLISIPFLLNSKFRAELSNADKLLMTSFALYTIGCFLLLLYHQENIKEYDKPSRFLFILPVILLLLKAEFKTQWTFIGIALGSITACIFAIYQTKFLGIPRAVGFTGGQPIRFGNMALLFGLLSFSGSFLFYQQKKVCFIAFVYCGWVFGLRCIFSIRLTWWMDSITYSVIFPLLASSGAYFKKTIYYNFAIDFNIHSNSYNDASN